jgi:hypothetical protein
MRMAALLVTNCLAACSAWDRPSVLDQHAAMLRYQATARETRANEDLSTHEQALALDRANRDSAEQQQTAQFAAAVAAQQAALTKLLPMMRGCVLSRALSLTGTATDNADAIVSASLHTCRPAIIAVARTVELAHLSSQGLADDMAARLRPEVTQFVITRQAEMQAASDHADTNAAP